MCLFLAPLAALAAGVVVVLGDVDGGDSDRKFNLAICPPSKSSHPLSFSPLSLSLSFSLSPLSLSFSPLFLLSLYLVLSTLSLSLCLPFSRSLSLLKPARLIFPLGEPGLHTFFCLLWFIPASGPSFPIVKKL
jgi:hypothetical protein